MTNKETVERNIGLTFDFINHLIDNPNLIDDLPEDFKLEFLEKDFPNLEKKDMEKGDKSKRKYVRVRNSFEISS
jgi:hypothetical protein